MSKLIATHSGTFHCDESLAVFMLRQLPEYKDAKLVRTRDPKRLAEADIVVDVGGEYDHERKRYDHHQRGFDQVIGLEGFKTKLSSAGLVYKHYGKRIIQQNLATGSKESSVVDLLYSKVYADFVEAIDAIDNGIPAYQGQAAYRSRTDLSSRVAQLNPRWNEPYNDAVLDERFERASALTGKEFLERVDYLSNAWLPARQLVAEALERAQQRSPDEKRIIEFEGSLPWKEHLYELEQQSVPEKDRPLYALYPESSENPKDGNWRVQCVPVSSDSFESRKPLPEAWRGVRDDALSQLSGIDGCIFVHASGFIGGNKTRQGALEMAKKALSAQ